MSAAQKADRALVFNGMRNAGLLDYVACWYHKAAEWMAAGKNAECCFVSTNSITQGGAARRAMGGSVAARRHHQFCASDISLDQRSARSGGGALRDHRVRAARPYRKNPVRLCTGRRRAAGNPGDADQPVSGRRTHGGVAQSADGIVRMPVDRHRQQADRWGLVPVHPCREGGVPGAGTGRSFIISALDRFRRIPERDRTLVPVAARRTTRSDPPDARDKKTRRACSAIPARRRRRQERPQGEGRGDRATGGDTDANARGECADRSLPGYPRGVIGNAQLYTDGVCGSRHAQQQLAGRPPPSNVLPLRQF